MKIDERARLTAFDVSATTGSEFTVMLRLHLLVQAAPSDRSGKKVTTPAVYLTTQQARDLMEHIGQKLVLVQPTPPTSH